MKPILFLSLSLCLIKGYAQDVVCSFQQNIEIIPDMLSVHQVTSEANRTISVEVTYAGLGWLGFGFSSKGEMVGNIGVIGQPGGIVSDLPNPAKYELGGFGVSSIQQLPTNRQTLMDESIDYNDTHTILRFTKFLEEEGELSISATDENIAIYAIGDKIELLGMHEYNGAFPVVLSACSNVTDGDAVADVFNNGRIRKDFWKIHGYMMAAAWALFLPIGIGSSMLRKFIPGQHTWLALHGTFNMVTLLVALGAFGLAVYTFTEEKKTHFSGTHEIVGLVIIVLAVLQLFGGMFRPHVVKRDDSEQPITTAERIRTAWQVFHRTLGIGIFCTAMWNCQTGIDLFFEKFDDGNKDLYVIVLWSVAGGLLFFIMSMVLVGKLF